MAIDGKGGGPGPYPGKMVSVIIGPDADPADGVPASGGGGVEGALSSHVFTIPEGMVHVDVEVQGAGGGEESPKPDLVEGRFGGKSFWAAPAEGGNGVLRKEDLGSPAVPGTPPAPVRGEDMIVGGIRVSTLAGVKIEHMNVSLHGGVLGPQRAVEIRAIVPPIIPEQMAALELALAPKSEPPKPIHWRSGKPVTHRVQVEKCICDMLVEKEWAAGREASKHRPPWWAPTDIYDGVVRDYLDWQEKKRAESAEPAAPARVVPGAIQITKAAAADLIALLRNLKSVTLSNGVSDRCNAAILALGGNPDEEG